MRSLEPFYVGLNPPQAAAAGKLRRCERAENQSENETKKPRKANLAGLIGGLYWTRTSDPIDVNDVLYQLSQQTKSLGTKDSIA